MHDRSKKEMVTKLKCFEFASDLRKPHLSNSMRSKAIQLLMKCFNFVYAIPHNLLTISLHSFLNYFWTGWARQVRFALTACKFEGLHLCHLFSYDSLSLPAAKSLNVAKERIKKMAWKIWNDTTPQHLKKLWKLLSQKIATLIQSRDAQTWYWLIGDLLVFLNSLTSQLKNLFSMWEDFFCEDSRSWPSQGRNETG